MDNIYAEFSPKAAVPGQPPNIYAEFAPGEGDGVVKGLAKAFGSEVLRGAADLPGTVGDIREAVPKIIAWAGGKLGRSDVTSEMLSEGLKKNLAASGPLGRLIVAAPTGEEIVHAGEERAGIKLYDPKTIGERYVGAVGRMLPGAALGPIRSAGEAALNLIRYGAAPGVGGELAADTAKTLAPGLEPYARFAGQIVSPFGASRVITPRHIEPQAKEMQRALQAHGVEPTVEQVTRQIPEQLRDFSVAAANKIGLNELPTTGPNGAFTKHFEATGRQFSDLGQRNTLIADKQLLGDLTSTFNEYHAIPGVHDPGTLDAVRGSIKHVIETAASTGGAIPGDAYQTIRSRLNKASMGAKDPERGAAIREIVEALDDGMERSIARTGSPDAGLWPQARRDYRNGLVLEKALGSGGMGAARGVITPDQLASAAKSVYGKRTYLRGHDDFSELSQPGVGLLSKPPGAAAPISEWQRVSEAFPWAHIGGLAALGLAPGHGTEEAVLHLLAGEAGGGAAGYFGRKLLTEPVRKLAQETPLGRAWQTNVALSPEQRQFLPHDWLSSYNMIRALQGGGDVPGRPRVNVKPSQLTP